MFSSVPHHGLSTCLVSGCSCWNHYDHCRNGLSKFWIKKTAQYCRTPNYSLGIRSSNVHISASFLESSMAIDLHPSRCLSVTDQPLSGVPEGTVSSQEQLLGPNLPLCPRCRLLESCSHYHREHLITYISVIHFRNGSWVTIAVSKDHTWDCTTAPCWSFARLVCVCLSEWGWTPSWWMCLL